MDECPPKWLYDNHGVIVDIIIHVMKMVVNLVLAVYPNDWYTRSRRSPTIITDFGIDVVIYIAVYTVAYTVVTDTGPGVIADLFIHVNAKWVALIKEFVTACYTNYTNGDPREPRLVAI